MGGHRELLIGFDLETTGTDPREAHIVTAAVTENAALFPRTWGASQVYRGILADGALR
ncbi:hypothetical protein [Streptomyces cavernae]|uniref:hypothetical protein n=1 Tax=Streptomyces cavernae TaxID=2259034 RepID=UPI003B75D1E0